MRILALNASPNHTKGNTHAVLRPFLDSAAEHGAEVQTVLVADLDVQPCRGCFACWRGAGECVIRDDMDSLRPQIATAEVLVLGAPLYLDAIPGPLKTVVDRLLPLAQPRIELVKDHCRHPRRDMTTGLNRIALVSVCGFWEADNFDPLVAWVEALGRNVWAEVAGRLLRPHAYAYSRMPGLAPPKRAVTRALRSAGRELVEEGRISRETEAAVAAPLISRGPYVAMANRSW